MSSTFVWNPRFIAGQHPRQDVVYGLSYPRCGSTWFRYCFEFITKRASLDKINAKWDTKAELPQLLFSSHRYMNTTYRLHHYRDGDPLIKSIWLRRDYKEAIVSQVINHFSLWPASAFLSTYVGESPTEDIIQMCNKLSTSSVGDRLKAFEYFLHTSSVFCDHILSEMFLYQDIIVYHMYMKNGLALRYEDLMLDSRSTLTKVIDYLVEQFSTPPYPFPPLAPREEMISHLDELMENYNYHCNVCLNDYRLDGHLGATTDDRDTRLSCYSEQLSERSLLLLEDAYEKAFFDPACAEASIVPPSSRGEGLAGVFAFENFLNLGCYQSVKEGQ